MTDVTETPVDTLATATQDDVLPLHQLVLIGTVVKPGTAKAIVRTASGKIRSVRRGDQLGGAKIVGIDEGRLALARGDRSVTLKLKAG